MKRFKLFLPLIASLIAWGCASQPAKQEIERGQQAVVEALEAWKANQAAAKLRSLPEPVEFTDENQKVFSLVEYSLAAVDASEPPFLRYTVKMKLKDQAGQLSEREAVYAVRLTNPIRVVRDPYF